MAVRVVDAVVGPTAEEEVEGVVGVADEAEIGGAQVQFYRRRIGEALVGGIGRQGTGVGKGLPVGSGKGV